MMIMRKKPLLNIRVSVVYVSCLTLMLCMCEAMLSKSAVAQPQEDSDIQLLVRGDDMGISHATNKALIQSYEKGIQKSVEVIVPSAWFPEAVHMVNDHPDIDVGVHLTLTSEWSNVKWRPLTNSTSITDSNGYFYPLIWPAEGYEELQALQSHQWKIKEIEQEFRKQIEVAKANIHNLTHLSYHMGCNDIDPQVAEMTDRLAKEYNLDILLDEYQVERIRMDGRDKSSEEKITVFIEKLRKLTPGNHLFVGHPALDTPEMQAVHMKNYKNVARDRQGITDLFISPRVKKVIEELGIKLISYSDLERLAAKK